MVLSALRQLAQSGEIFSVDLAGGPIDLGELVDPVSPGLVVGPVTEAVKQVSDGMVAQYVNRDTLWAVHGFVLDAEVVAMLPDQARSAEDVIAAVLGMGRNWFAVPQAGAPPE